MCRAQEVFAQTGIQFMQINSLYQFYALKLAGSPALACARTLLFMPDLLNYWLTGVARAEVTIASTSQFYDPRTQDLGRRSAGAARAAHAHSAGNCRARDAPRSAARLRRRGRGPGSGAGLRHRMPRYRIGRGRRAGEGRDWCYISSGTWSLMGAELDEPIINERALAENLTNEIGAAGKVRFLKNIAGLWLLQECRRAWALRGSRIFLRRTGAAGRRAPSPSRALIDPDAFLEPGDMPRKIAEHCRALRPGAARNARRNSRALFSKAWLGATAQVLESLETLAGRRFDVIHIVGGGSRNALLNQFVADATGRTAIAGPSEATAIGNVLIQAMGAGELAGLEEARGVVRRSFGVEVYGG